jgi:NADH pyrophosphatase NudC (nudix superfamily)
MRSLGTIRARVDRLASILPTSGEPLIVHWVHRHTRCPACGADLEGHAEALALAAARADQGAQVFYWADDLATCPRCGATLP